MIITAVAAAYREVVWPSASSEYFSLMLIMMPRLLDKDKRCSDRRLLLGEKQRHGGVCSWRRGYLGSLRLRDEPSTSLPMGRRLQTKYPISLNIRLPIWKEPASISLIVTRLRNHAWLHHGCPEAVLSNIVFLNEAGAAPVQIPVLPKQPWRRRDSSHTPQRGLKDSIQSGLLLPQF